MLEGSRQSISYRVYVGCPDPWSPFENSSWYPESLGQEKSRPAQGTSSVQWQKGLGTKPWSVVERRCLLPAIWSGVAVPPGFLRKTKTLVAIYTGLTETRNVSLAPCTLTGISILESHHFYAVHSNLERKLGLKYIEKIPGRDLADFKWLNSVYHRFFAVVSCPCKAKLRS